MRDVFGRDAVYRFLDEGFVCHGAFVADGQSYAIPTAYAPVGDAILHESSASRSARALADGADLRVTLLGGLVLARPGFSQSMNYRSVVGRARSGGPWPRLASTAVSFRVERRTPGRLRRC